MKDGRVTIGLLGQLRRRLQEAARRTGSRQSDLVRKAVERQCAAEDDALTTFERAEKAGLIGVVKGAAEDLSTNQTYFEGFGSS